MRTYSKFNKWHCRQRSLLSKQRFQTQFYKCKLKGSLAKKRWQKSYDGAKLTELTCQNKVTTQGFRTLFD